MVAKISALNGERAAFSVEDTASDGIDRLLHEGLIENNRVYRLTRKPTCSKRFGRAGKHRVTSPHTVLSPC
jgi:hypothetical protein